ncbi:Probable Fmu protein (SUN protein) [Mycobacteroides abscessus]|nr:Probable Fmu protein (SUN protein) [Mycobacteroides abscessus]
MSTRPPRRRPNQDSRRSAGPAERARRKLDPPRQAALDVLRAVSRQDAYANLALPALLRERGITGRDAAFATELTYGTCRARGLLDAVIAAAAGRTIDQVDEGLRDPLRLGAYQLLRTRVEPHAALSTTVDAVAVEFDQGRAGFVNAVLRTISRRDEADWVEELAPPESDRIGRLAFATAHPRWIAQSFSDALGPAGSGLPRCSPVTMSARSFTLPRVRAGSMRKRWRRRSAAPSAAIHPSPYTYPEGIRAGWSRYATAWRRCRTKAAS